MTTPDPQRAQRTARIIHAAFLCGVVIYAIVLAALLGSGFETVFTGDSDADWAVVFGMASGSIVSLALGLFLPRAIVARARHTAQPTRALLPAVVLRAAFFESIGVTGFVRGLLGAPWLASGVFLLVSAVALAASFPGREPLRIPPR